MTKSFLEGALAVGILASAPILGGCDNAKSPEQKPTDTKAAGQTNRSVQTKTDARPTSSTNAHGLVIQGERFTTRTIRDEQQNLIFAVFQAPEKWRDQSKVVWDYSHVSNPVDRVFTVENPDNDEAFFGYAAARYFWCTPNYGLSRPGQNSLGLIEAQRVPPLQALGYFIKQIRGSFPKLEFTGYKDLPELPAALKVTPYPNMQMTGLGARVTYERNGHMVEEEFYCLPYTINIPYDGPQGRSWQNNWGLDVLHSFRAPLGTLDKRRAIFATMVKSVRPNPAWQQRHKAIQDYLQNQFNQQLQAGYDQIAAAARLSRQISANNDAMIASIDRQLASSRTGVGGGSQGRSAADNFDDYIRGVDTVNDPYWGTSQHSYNEKYHWTDGYGSYRNSNDPSYDPNRNENGAWQLMQPVR